MRSFIVAALATAVSAHSWLECTNHDNTEIRKWMQGNSTLSPPVIIDPAMPWYANLCNGWPRNKANPGNWIDESTNYIWNIGANSWNGGSYHPADTHACPPGQRSPTYQANAPMAKGSPGGMIRLRFGGNGHARGAPMGDAGSVSVYWKGKPEAEITDISEFTQANLLQTAPFAADSFSYPADPKVISPVQGLVDKGNWLELKLPSTMAPGRHMMVWTWSYSGAVQWSTCFDINVSGAASSGSSSGSAPAPASPQASPAAAAAPSAKAQVAAPVANAQVPETPKYSSVAAIAARPSLKPITYAASSVLPAVASAAPVVVPSAAPQVQPAQPKKQCKARYRRRDE